MVLFIALVVIYILEYSHLSPKQLQPLPQEFSASSTTYLSILNAIATVVFLTQSFDQATTLLRVLWELTVTPEINIKSLTLFEVLSLGYQRLSYFLCLYSFLLNCILPLFKHNHLVFFWYHCLFVPLNFSLLLNLLDDSSRFWSLTLTLIMELVHSVFLLLFNIIIYYALSLLLTHNYCFMYSSYSVSMTFYLLHWFCPSGNLSTEKTWIFLFYFKTMCFF